MKYELNTFHRNIPEQELLDNLLRVSVRLKTNTLTTAEYNEFGEFHFATYQRRFGNWNKALEKAGLKATLNQNITRDELLLNIEKVWVTLGRQPTQRDLHPPISKYTSKPYYSKYGTWRKALDAFVEFITSDNKQEIEKTEVEENTSKEDEIVFKHKTKRQPSERLKVQVLMRDGNKCRLCGIILTGENIHFDHILAWSKGGETVLENLQILCAPHNLAKGNIEYNVKQN